MHGGAAGVIFDMSTTTALCPIAQPGFWEFMGGVTRSLNISYLKAVPLGITVRLNIKVVSVGKQMAMIRGEMTSQDGKIVYCTAEHHKVNVPVTPEHLNARVAWDEEFAKEWKAKREPDVKSKI
jgi:acyl-coenzyme A thioesterase 13